MEKKVKLVPINHYIGDWDGMIEISQLRQNLDAAEEAGATHIEIYSENDYGDCVSADPYIQREETDEEFHARKGNMDRHIKAVEERELKELKRLQEKYKS